MGAQLFEQGQLYFLGAILTVYMLAAVSFCWRPWRACFLLTASSGLIFAALNCGYVAFPPPPSELRRTKIFGIGLSRTGTTSLTVALNQANVSTYHALPHILDWSSNPMKPLGVNKRWANAYDAVTDIQASLVFKELAELFPSALFVYNSRPADKWGRSMARFMEKHAVLWRTLQQLHDMGVPVPPVDHLFHAMYGDWQHHGVEDWVKQYHRHDADVAAFFSEGDRAWRLLNISFTEGEGWETLGPFLGIDRPPAGAFPRADVFELSSKLQPWWQLEHLARWIDGGDRSGALIVGIVVAMLVVLVGSRFAP